MYHILLIRRFLQESYCIGCNASVTSGLELAAQALCGLCRQHGSDSQSTSSKQKMQAVSDTATGNMVDVPFLQGLRAHGHNVTEGRYTAVTQAIVVDPDRDTLIGASDPRKDGAPAAY